MKRRATSRHDYLIRVTFIAAGLVAAAVFAMKGQADVLPPLALGGLIGAALIGGLQSDRD